MATYVHSAKLLKVPKIYNALITSKEKILPSEAYPGTTGPIFQPIGLPLQTLYLQPPVLVDGIGKNDNLNSGNGENGKVPSGKSKILQPVTFYPSRHL
ncbi:hypothetical protein Phum_PHUM161150 [Pediculus humanus corporis]|uniref:Uncharacterized protein n=1 Tax=Pediculus humanus subsp. corporis TaxID=121224 RepID=E0VFL5_PEDHC|nr:uncharacterized protein Phum_PHUM161150 [Pediculus humanus corporis]EEB12171.1 hypothetical protein Phum_PHUM161150 [Pediculus humanus corporis]